MERTQDAHDFHHDGAAGRVIGGTGTTVPGIEVGTNDDYFVFFGTARNFGDDVFRIQIFIADGRFQVDADFYGFFFFGQAGDAIVLFFCHAELRDGEMVCRFAGSGLFTEDPAFVGAVVFDEDGGCAFGDEPLVAFVAGFAVALSQGFTDGRRHSGEIGGGRLRVIGDLDVFQFDGDFRGGGIGRFGNGGEFSVGIAAEIGTGAQ